MSKKKKKKSEKKKSFGKQGYKTWAIKRVGQEGRNIKHNSPVINSIDFLWRLFKVVESLAAEQSGVFVPSPSSLYAIVTFNYRRVGWGSFFFPPTELQVQCFNGESSALSKRFLSCSSRQLWTAPTGPLDSFLGCRLGRKYIKDHLGNASTAGQQRCTKRTAKEKKTNTKLQP